MLLHIELANIIIT